MGNEVMKSSDGQRQGNLSVFADADVFSNAFKMAETLAKSTIVPKSYQNNAANCLIAIEMAARINTSPMMVMQNLYIVNGTPAWSSQWIIAMINNSRRYKTELKFDMRCDNNGAPVSCMAWAEDYNGNKVVGPVITMEMARNEGWIGKSGSKWKTMPEVMIRYRAASFFGRLNCPDMIMGIYSQEEVIDGFGDEVEVEVVSEEAPAAQPEDNRQITQEDRQTFMEAISERFEGNEKRNQVFKEVLMELGLRSTSSMTYSQLEKAIDLVKKKAESKDGSSDAGEKTEAEEEQKTE